ncbi:MAG: hypothetical protein HRU70_08675 [Phycisphaeraceae bacterium]|nr:MAG: hypothetical protein HRU70_08675 [Phycisphaeraceae bacterium]
MSQTKNVALLAGAALSLGFLSPAMAQSSLVKDRQLNAELTADSLSRASLQGGSAGSGFRIVDGNTSLTVGGLMQFRYTANFRDDGTSTAPAGTITTDDDFTQGWANTSTKLWFKGTVGDPNLSFYLQGAFMTGRTDDINPGPPPTVGSSSESNSFILEDAYGEYAFNDSTSVRWGQFKLPILREESVSEQYQLAAQRSVTNAAFNQGRSQAAMISYRSDQFRFMAATGDGLRSQNTDFNSANEADWSLTARAEFLFQGNDWGRFNDFTSFQGSAFTGMVGAAIHYQQSGDTGDGFDAIANTGGSDTLLYTIDVSLEGDGWNLYGAFIGANQNPDAAGEGTTDSFGVVLQGGVFLDPNWEIFGRWDAILADDNAGPSPTKLDPSDFHFLTFGVNYYFIPQKHTLKFTLQAVIGLTETYDLTSVDPLSGGAGTSAPGYGAPLPFLPGGILGDIDSGEVALQAQVQVLW